MLPVCLALSLYQHFKLLWFYNVLSYIWCRYAFLIPPFQSVLDSLYPDILDEVENISANSKNSIGIFIGIGLNLWIDMG